MSSSWPRWDAGDDLIGPGSPADQLWELLRSLDEGEDTGRQGVTAGKLLARKRPHLIPVYGSQVKAQARLEGDASWWQSLRCALRDETLRARLVELRHQARVPAAVGLSGNRVAGRCASVRRPAMRERRLEQPGRVRGGRPVTGSRSGRMTPYGGAAPLMCVRGGT
jgi:hypothetical protein